VAQVAERSLANMRPYVQTPVPPKKKKKKKKQFKRLTSLEQNLVKEGPMSPNNWLQLLLLLLAEPGE
jgi:hypothetical protein